jgi:hypothetical protein
MQVASGNRQQEIAGIVEFPDRVEYIVKWHVRQQDYASHMTVAPNQDYASHMPVAQIMSSRNLSSGKLSQLAIATGRS